MSEETMKKLIVVLTLVAAASGAGAQSRLQSQSPFQPQPQSQAPALAPAPAPAPAQAQAQAQPKTISQRATDEQKASCERWGNTRGTVDFNRCIYQLVDPVRSKGQQSFARQCAVDFDLVPNSVEHKACIGRMEDEWIAKYEADQRASRDRVPMERPVDPRPVDPILQGAQSACSSFGYSEGSDAFARCVQGRVEAVQNQAAKQEWAAKACAMEFAEKGECLANPQAFFERKAALERAQLQQFQPPPIRPMVTCTTFGPMTTCQ